MRNDAVISSPLGGLASSLEEDDAERRGRIVPSGRRYLTLTTPTQSSPPPQTLSRLATSHLFPFPGKCFRPCTPSCLLPPAYCLLFLPFRPDFPFELPRIDLLAPL